MKTLQLDGASLVTNQTFEADTKEVVYGFFWHYAKHFYSARRIEIQAVFAGQITAPVPAFMDDFGTLVAIREAA